MSTKQWKAIIAGAIIIIILSTLTMMPRDTNVSPPDTHNMDKSTTETPITTEFSQDETLSPYTDKWYYRSVIDVYHFHLDLSEVYATVISQPNEPFVIRFNAEDTLTIKIPLQNNIDIDKLQLIYVSHDNMQDPYRTPISAFNIIDAKQFTAKDDWLECELVIGYDSKVIEGIDVLFVYNDIIEAYSMFKVVTDDSSLMSYWQHQYSDENVLFFNIQCGDEILRYYYFDEGSNSFTQWIQQATNVDEWFIENNYMVNKEKSWAVPLQTYSLLSNGMTVIAEPYESTIDSIYTYESDNPAYGVYYLGKTHDFISQTFGNAMKTTRRGNFTKLDYDIATFYIDDAMGVVQIDLLSTDLAPINGLPNTLITASQLLSQCVSIGAPHPQTITNNNMELSTYSTALLFYNNNWSIGYIWNDNEPVNIMDTECSRIVICLGERYYF